jgi:hypothetical protein
MPNVIPLKELPVSFSSEEPAETPCFARTAMSTTSTAVTEMISRTRPSRVESWMPAMANAAAATIATIEMISTAAVPSAGRPAVVSRLDR